MSTDDKICEGTATATLPPNSTPHINIGTINIGNNGNNGIIGNSNTVTTNNTVNNYNIEDALKIFRDQADPELRELLKDRNPVGYQSLVKLWEGHESSIPEVQKLISSVALLESNGGVSTAFMATVDGTNVIFGAGHSFLIETETHEQGCVYVEKELQTGHDLNEYTLMFGNLKGTTMASKSSKEKVTLGELRREFETTLVVQCDTTIQQFLVDQDGNRAGPANDEPANVLWGKKVTNNDFAEKKMFPLDQGMDYFYLILHHPKPAANAGMLKRLQQCIPGRKKRVQDKLERIEPLECGQDDFLTPCPGESLLIIGHPFTGKRLTPESCLPLRLDWGKEVDVAKNGKRLVYDMDSLGGNSGSPIIGSGAGDSPARVKAIHVQGSQGKGNQGQTMTKIVSEIKASISKKNP